MDQAIVNSGQFYGYNGQLLRVDMTTGKIKTQALDEKTARKYIGGANLGIRIIYDEVDPSGEWSDPENRLFLGSGPLGGTRIGGSGSIAAVTRGALTNGIASSQANGLFGAYLRFAGYDGIIVKGSASKWKYLHIHDGIAELKDAEHLLGKTTFDTEISLKQELNKTERQASVLAIGPAGENLVRFACLMSDGGHAAAHNGIGAVMGSKKLKAIIIERRARTFPIKDRDAISELAKELLANAKTDSMNASTLLEGTVGGVVFSTPAGMVPVKNYTSNIHVIDPEKLQTYTAANIRNKFNAKPSPCWACTAKHCHTMEITEGKYSGRIVEEPEYEGMAAFSSLVGIDDVTTTVVLNSEVDSLGMDVNETGWVLAWVMECFEKRLLTLEDTDGLEMNWGNSEAIMTLLGKIARREGFGNILAEGVMRAAKTVGGQTANLAIHTMKGNTPRGHDHRRNWQEMFDTCVSNTGTLESHFAAPYKLLGISPTYDRFDPMAVSTIVATIKGCMFFDDSLVTCRINTINTMDILCRAVNAVTGWDMEFEEALTAGRRAVNLARAFNLRAGIKAELDAPSLRYGSAPLDGPMAGVGIMPHWDKMLRNYYEKMGWDVATGIPLPETLRSLSLNEVVTQLWPQSKVA
jgi:aldehyde:ferredoxin oxidoreductase